jgi:hypothetical protein
METIVAIAIAAARTAMMAVMELVAVIVASHDGGGAGQQVEIGRNCADDAAGCRMLDTVLALGLVAMTHYASSSSLHGVAGGDRALRVAEGEVHDM